MLPLIPLVARVVTWGLSLWTVYDVVSTSSTATQQPVEQVVLESVKPPKYYGDVVLWGLRVLGLLLAFIFALLMRKKRKK